MARQRYRNGDEISLGGGCDGCSPATINGVFCHEKFCPEAWRDYEKDCGECGCEFYPEERFQRICGDCQNPPDDELENDDDDE